MEGGSLSVSVGLSVHLRWPLSLFPCEFGNVSVGMPWCLQLCKCVSVELSRLLPW